MSLVETRLEGDDATTRCSFPCYDLRLRSQIIVSLGQRLVFAHLVVLVGRSGQI